MKNIISKGVSILFLSAPLAAIADQGTWYSSDHMWGSGGWMWGGMYMWVIIFALVVLGVYAVSKSSKTSDTDGNDQSIESTPIDILNTRYAKGEIDKEEYESHKKALQS